MIRLKGFQKLTTVDDALRKFFDTLQIKMPKAIIVSLNSALNRILAEDIIASEDVPRFDRSAVDGFAVKAEGTFKASQSKPKTLKIVNKAEIGGKQAKKVWTGNPIPKGANAVVMLESAKSEDYEVEIWVPAIPGQNVSRRGEDVKKGEVAAKTGIRLKPHHLGLIAELGFGRIKVFEKPKIAVLATGNELVEVGSKPREDQIFEVSRLVISNLCQELDAKPVDLGLAKDDLDEICGRLKTGLKIADAIITTGGTSVGVLDLVPDAVNRIGKPGVIVHGIAMRPAMPTAIAIVDQKPIVILSGNPVAAMFGFEVFARPIICKLLGLKQEEHRPIVKARMTRKIAAALGRKTYVRVHVFQHGEQFSAEPISARGSGIISTMSRANGYVVVPENREGLVEGETVSVHLFGNVEVS